MADTWFITKEWKARLVEFAGRRLLRNVANGESTTYDVSRSEGQVSQEGDAFNTKNMNDLEQRISNGFAKAKTNIDSLNDNGAIKGMDAREDGVYITYSTGADTVTKKLGNPEIKHKDFSGNSFSTTITSLGGEQIIGCGMISFDCSTSVDNNNFSYSFKGNSSFTDTTASGKLERSNGGGGSGPYGNFTAIWRVYYI